jgi:hypothetical protein
MLQYARRQWPDRVWAIEGANTTQAILTVIEPPMRIDHRHHRHHRRPVSHLLDSRPPRTRRCRRRDRGVVGRELGVTLFDRTSRQVRLTAAGQRLLPEARAVLAAADRTRQVATEVRAVARCAWAPARGWASASPRYSTSLPTPRRHCRSGSSAPALSGGSRWCFLWRTGPVNASIRRSFGLGQPWQRG